MIFEMSWVNTWFNPGKLMFNESMSGVGREQ